MPENPDLALQDLMKTGVWGFNATSGKWKPAKVNDAGELVVTTGGGGGGGSSQVDKSGFTEGTTSFTVAGGIFNETPASDPTEDQAAAARITAKRAVHVNLRSNAGTEIGTTTTPLEARAKIWDGTNQLSINAFGQPSISNDPLHIDGKGTAGTPSGGVVSVQGVASGTVLPVSDGGGLLSVDDGAGSLTVDGAVTADTELNLFDHDTGAGTVNQPALGILIPGAGGPTLWDRGITDNGGSLTVDQATPANLQATVTPAASTVWDVSDRAARLLGVLSAGTNRIGSVRVVDSADADQTSAKGTQTSRFLGVQSVVDAGRVNIMWNAEFAATSAAEALLTITESRDGAATTTFTTKVVTSGKRLRITSISMTVTATTGTPLQRAVLRMRFNTAGAVTTTSPLQGVWEVDTNVATAKAGGWLTVGFPDGIEYLGDGTKQIGFGLLNPDWVSATAVPSTRVTITAFEY